MTRFNPWRRELSAPIHALQSELNRLLEEYWNPVRLSASQGSPTDLEPSAWLPAIDVYETSGEVVLLAELPGVEPQSIELSVTGNVLSLKGQKPRGDVPEAEGALNERRYGPFHRHVPLSADVDLDAAQAEFRDGLLRVRLPLKQASRPRTIPIRND